MGLAIEVGYLADIIENDSDGAEGFRENLDRLNQFLVSQGMQTHNEPTDCPVESFDMGGYSGIHFLRRIAAHLDLRGILPPPGDPNASEDRVLLEYYKLAEGPGVVGRLLRRTSKSRSFDHLILHSDAEGYYLPHDFPRVLFPPVDLKIPGGMVGSSFRLREECRRHAAVLKLDLQGDPWADEMCDAVESQFNDGADRQQYAVESFVCLQLNQACEHSIKHGAAIVFT